MVKMLDKKAVIFCGLVYNYLINESTSIPKEDALKYLQSIMTSVNSLEEPAWQIVDGYADMQLLDIVLEEEDTYQLMSDDMSLLDALYAAIPLSIVDASLKETNLAILNLSRLSLTLHEIFVKKYSRKTISASSSEEAYDHMQKVLTNADATNIKIKSPLMVDGEIYTVPYICDVYQNRAVIKKLESK